MYDPRAPPAIVCRPEELTGCFASGLTTENYAEAAHHGHLQCLQYLHSSGHEWHRRTCVYAAAAGHLCCLKYAHENGCPWEQTCAGAARTGQLLCLQYAHENGCWWDELTCELAAATGQLDCLKYAHQQGCMWDPQTICEYAVRGQNLHCLCYCFWHGGKLQLSSVVASALTSTGQSRVRLPPLGIEGITHANELFVKAFVICTLRRVCYNHAAETIQLAWRKRFYRPDSLYCKRLKDKFDTNKTICSASSIHV